MTLELDARITQELKTFYKKLNDERQLYSDEKLTQYYSTFRNKFGPDNGVTRRKPLWFEPWWIGGLLVGLSPCLREKRHLDNEFLS